MYILQFPVKVVVFEFLFCRTEIFISDESEFYVMFLLFQTAGGGKITKESEKNFSTFSHDSRTEKEKTFSTFWLRYGNETRLNVY